MSDGAIITPSGNVTLAQRVDTLARLVETHPAYHLLAEYEALFIDRHCCAGDTVPCMQQAADDLLARVNGVIALLETNTAPGRTISG